LKKIATLTSVSLVPVAEQPKAWVYSRSLAWILGSNPAGDMDVCLFVGLITRPEESYRM
jgi:hypothetical protein